jgi:hypothetical protein
MLSETRLRKQKGKKQDLLTRNEQQPLSIKRSVRHAHGQ